MWTRRLTLNEWVKYSNIKYKFLIVRHGESIWNKSSKFTGWTNVPLSENGKKESNDIGKSLIMNNLVPNIIFTSVLDRSINTANIIKKEIFRSDQDIPIHTSWRLNEKHYGTIEGLPRQIIRNDYGDKFTNLIRNNFFTKPPIVRRYDHLKDTNEFSVYKNCYINKLKFGESKKNVLERLLPYYENDILHTLTENKFPLIVTHKHCARVLMKHLLKISDDDFQTYKLPDKKILLICLNENHEYDKHYEFEY
jgi:bisphosphoglycerate-dependent phosphoglycerate mutase family 1